jgi:hypothetical protein
VDARRIITILVIPAQLIADAIPAYYRALCRAH